MDQALNYIGEFGIAVVALIALGIFCYRIITRIMDENKERELRASERQDKLTESLNNVAHTIEKSNNTNEQLAETNRLLVDKVEGDLSGIKTNIELINNKLEK